MSKTYEPLEVAAASDDIPTASTVEEDDVEITPMVNAVMVDEKTGGDQPTTVEVIAPVDLRPGYEFSVEFEGKSLWVAVPDGKVVLQGSRFQAIVLGEGRPSPMANIPQGGWRDGLCECFAPGWCHPSCCWSYWCPFVMLGQILKRYQYNVFVKHRPDDTNNNPSCQYVIYLIYAMVAGLFIPFAVMVYDIWFLCMACKTRAMMRHKHGIPEQVCHGCEDCCCIVCCRCCTLAQMARHSVDYKQVPGDCCSETGYEEDEFRYGGALQQRRAANVV